MNDLERLSIRGYLFYWRCLHGIGYVTVRLYVPSIDSSYGGRQVCCWVPCGQEMSIASCVRRAAGVDAQQQMSRCVTLTADAYLWQTYLPFRENPPNIPPSDTRSCFKAEHAYSPSTNGGRRVPLDIPHRTFPPPILDIADISLCMAAILHGMPPECCVYLQGGTKTGPQTHGLNSVKS